MQKTIWITGASSGIGREFARRYAAMGCRLILTARRADRLQALAKELHAAHGTECRIETADLSRAEECSRLCEVLADEHIDIFINNAGFGVCGSILETEEAREEEMVQVNVAAMARLFRAVVRKMNAQGFGVTETSKGEVMAYEPASLNKDGSVPAYERGRDWPVSAETLKNRYDLDVTHNWFEQNTPKDAGTLPDGDLAMQNARLAQEQMRDEQQLLEPVASDGSMDNDGRTPDPNSGIESHDGADTDSRTAVMDAEQTGSEIRPSDIREEQQYDSESYSLTGEARDMTAAKTQIETETKSQETTREHGSSLPFNGEDVL